MNACRLCRIVVCRNNTHCRQFDQLRIIKVYEKSICNFIRLAIAQTWYVTREKLKPFTGLGIGDWGRDFQVMD